MKVTYVSGGTFTGTAATCAELLPILSTSGTALFIALLMLVGTMQFWNGSRTSRVVVRL